MQRGLYTRVSRAWTKIVFTPADHPKAARNVEIRRDANELVVAQWTVIVSYGIV
jgi:hypothetical protein